MKLSRSKFRVIVFSYPQWLCGLMVVLCGFFYWGFVASDQYVSEAVVVLESPEAAAPTLSFSSLFSGGANVKDLLLLREYLLSVDMVSKLEDELSIRAHYSDQSIDWWSRLDEDAYVGDLHGYLLSHISIVMDEYSSVLRVRVQAYSAQMAYEIASFLLIEGEQHMNDMGKALAQEQVKFMEIQVADISKRVNVARSELLAYQNEFGQISPEATAISLSAVVSSLEGELSAAKAKRAALKTYLSNQSNEIIRLDSEISAIETQISEQQSRLADATHESSLNEIAAGYKAIELKMSLALDLYRGALVALENTRAEATRKLKQVSILQSPRVPEYPIEPRRLYNMFSCFVVTLVCTVIASLLLTLVREHKD